MAIVLDSEVYTVYFIANKIKRPDRQKTHNKTLSTL